MPPLHRATTRRYNIFAMMVLCLVVVETMVRSTTPTHTNANTLGRVDLRLRPPPVMDFARTIPSTNGDDVLWRLL